MTVRKRLLRSWLTLRLWWCHARILEIRVTGFVLLHVALGLLYGRAIVRYFLYGEDPADTGCRGWDEGAD